MKFSQLYSSFETFQHIKFNTDINFVLSDGHSVGKTKFLELLDFCLLKQSSFVKDINLSDDTAFFLEIDNFGKFITIKRYIKKYGGIYIHTHDDSMMLLDFDDKDFEYKGLGIEKAKEKLNDLLNLELNGKKIENFRKYISYFLRTQDDQSDVFRLNKFARQKDIEYKPVVSELLGIDGETIRRKYELENEIASIEDEIKHLKDELKNLTRERIEAEIEVLEKMLQEKEELFDKFDFYKADNLKQKELVEKIEDEIVRLNKIKTSLLRELKYARKAIESELPIDESKLNAFFDEMKVAFPDSLKKDFDNVIRFNKILVEDRKRILKENIKRFQKELDVVDSELLKLNEQKSELIEFIVDADSMEKFKELEREIIDLKAKLEVEKQKLKMIEELESLIKQLEKTEEELKEINAKIDTMKNEVNSGKLKSIINKFAKIIFGEEAIFVVSLNTNKNLEFELKIADSKGNFENSRDDGHTFRKLLSFVFSLALAVYHSNERFFRFVAVDSPFDGDRVEYQEGLYNAMKEAAKYGIQIIATTVIDEIKIEDIREEIIKKYQILFLTDERKLLIDF